MGHGKAGVFVAGEAGIGKTALVRAFCESIRSSDRILEGACDPLFHATPARAVRRRRPAKPRRAAELVERGADPSEVFAAVRDELERPAPVLVLEDVHGGRSDTRRYWHSRPPDRGLARARDRHLPRRRARSATTRCASYSGSSRRSRICVSPSSRSHSKRSPTLRADTTSILRSSIVRRAATPSSRRRSWRPPAAGVPADGPRRGRRAHGTPARAGGLSSKPSWWYPRRSRSWLLKATDGRQPARSTNAWPPEC